MSISESDLIEKYWHRVGGQLVEEFRAVERGDDNGGRHIDAVIVKGGEKKRAGKYTTIPLKGEDVIVVQCKTKRLGMYLMGQAYFSMHLIGRHNPASIQSVALCTETDSVLGPIFEAYPNCEVVEIDPDG